MKNFLFLIFLMGCSGHYIKGEGQEGRKTYSYVDAGGAYKLVRDNKLVNKNLVTRSQLLDNRSGQAKVVEKSIMLAKMGSIKSKAKRLLVSRPHASEFSVWLEGKKYTSKMRIDPKTKSMKVELNSPEARWSGITSYPFPQGRYFCFFNQIPECLHHNFLLQRARDKSEQKIPFFVVWDGFPFIQDQLTGTGKKLFAPGSLKFDGEISGLFRYIVEVEGQMVLYQFSPDFEFVKLAWISQGITIAPPGQGIVEE